MVGWRMHGPACFSHQESQKQGITWKERGKPCSSSSVAGWLWLIVAECCWWLIIVAWWLLMVGLVWFPLTTINIATTINNHVSFLLFGLVSILFPVPSTESIMEQVTSWDMAWTMEMRVGLASRISMMGESAGNQRKHGDLRLQNYGFNLLQPSIFAWSRVSKSMPRSSCQEWHARRDHVLWALRAKERPGGLEILGGSSLDPRHPSLGMEAIPGWEDLKPLKPLSISGSWLQM